MRGWWGAGTAVGDPVVQRAQRGVVHRRVPEAVGDATAPIGFVETRAGVAVRCARHLPHPEPLGVDARDLREVRALELAVHDHDRGRRVGADRGAHAHGQHALLGTRRAGFPHREEEAVEDPFARVDGVEVRGETHGRLRSAGGNQALHRKAAERVDRVVVLVLTVGCEGPPGLGEEVERGLVAGVVQVAVALGVVLQQREGASRHHAFHPRGEAVEAHLLRADTHPRVALVHLAVRRRAALVTGGHVLPADDDGAVAVVGAPWTQHEQPRAVRRAGVLGDRPAAVGRWVVEEVEGAGGAFERELLEHVAAGGEVDVGGAPRRTVAGDRPRDAGGLGGGGGADGSPLTTAWSSRRSVA